MMNQKSKWLPKKLDDLVKSNNDVEKSKASALTSASVKTAKKK